MPLGFCCGGFSSTAGYVPGNEALHPKARATGVHRELIISLGRLSFLSDRLELSEDRSQRKPFGFGSERTRQRLSAPSALEQIAFQRSVPPLGAGRGARKQPRL